MLGRTDRRLRLIILLLALVVGAGALVVRQAYWAILRGPDLVDLARQQTTTSETVAVQRGAIYDRTGKVLLAGTAYRDQLVAYPDQLTTAQQTAEATSLVSLLGLDAADATALRQKMTGDAAYVVLEPALTADQSAAVRAGMDGSGADQLLQLDLIPQPYRIYPDPGGAPDTTLANQLLGFVNAAGQGQYGVEQYYQDELAGRAEVIAGARDVNGQPMQGDQSVVDPGQAGADLQLTLDASLQLQIEKELYAAYVADGAASASAVVMDPTTGAILAWASVPGYDENDYQSVASTDPGRFIDPVISTIYEPGSVMKMFVAAAGYSSGVIKPTTRFDDSGTLAVANGRIYDADRKPMGMLAFQDGIAYSRNVVAARAAETLGKSTAAASRALYTTWAALGIGTDTGVDVSGEVPGLATDPSRAPWTPIDLANHSFGQGVAVTPLQLATSYATMANGGFRVRPHVVGAVNGQAVQVAQGAPVLSGAVSAQLRALMTHVVTTVPYYHAGTYIPGYTVAGKTGTAQIWDSATNDWVPNTFDFSFVGYVGTSGPQAIIVIRLDHVKPKVLAQGQFQLGITSYQLFRRAAQDTIQALDLPPQTNATSSAAPVTPSQQPGMPEVPDVPPPSARP
ncbi:MAG TPA: penicillin-binding protein 2 [Candidatus Sulfotelmatobacter sp.]|nr:penicillin-binding protein 2 [Candidatus Sulfotelmatobacter sp.]